MLTVASSTIKTRNRLSSSGPFFISYLPLTVSEGDRKSTTARPADATGQAAGVSYVEQDQAKMNFWFEDAMTRRRVASVE